MLDTLERSKYETQCNGIVSLLENIIHVLISNVNWLEVYGQDKEYRSIGNIIAS